jgi:hypothetical protein
MQQQHLTEFYLERLQPTWLPTKQAQTIYSLLVRLLDGLLGGLLLGLLFGLFSHTCSSDGAHMFAVSLCGIGLSSGQGNQLTLGSMRLGALIPLRAG